MKRLLAIFLWLFSLLIYINAVPANVIPFVVSQSDGSKLTVELCGDEGFHFFKTSDNVPIVRDVDDFYYYAATGRDGKIISSGILAHERENREEFENTYVSSNFKKVADNIAKQWKSSFDLRNNSLRLNKPVNHLASKSVMGVSQGYYGDKKGLVILVNFANMSMSCDNPQKLFGRMFNEIGYSDNGHVGSVHDYFFDQSFGQFNLTFDVVGPVLLPNDYGYYGRNIDLTSGADANPREMVIEACRYADDFVDFKDYDWDKDGEVDQVFIVYAGYGEHSGAPSNTIWPHESKLGYLSITLDGVRINTYACSSEFIGNTGKILSGIGTACHEFSHCLGLPDLYDTDYSGGFGMSYWDVMNSGSYSGLKGTGEVPYGYSAYEKWQAGWLTPVEISETTKGLVIDDLTYYPSAYILYNEGERKEFFILENHQMDKWYSCLGNYRAQHGLMVTHIDYEENAWRSNAVNQFPEHQRYTIVPADNSYGQTIENLMGDLYPGSQNIVSLTNTSHVSSGGLLYNTNSDNSMYLNRTICNIREKDDVVVLDVLVGSDVVPTALDATDVSAEGYTANWSEVSDAESYSLACTTITSLFPLAIKNEVIEGITANKYVLAWEEKAISSSYKVKAIIQDIESPWSSTITVKKEYISGLKCLESDDRNVPTYYLLNGIRTNTIRKGLILKRGEDGKMQKTLR